MHIHVQIYMYLCRCMGFPGGSDGKESACNAGDAGDVSSILNQEDLLEEEKATHSSTLAWEIPWTKVSGRLYSPLRGSQRVGHD